jgi:hypothetical protein
VTDAHTPPHGLIPASIAAAATEGDETAAFDLLFCAGGGGGGSDYTAREDAQLLLQEFAADPEGRSIALRRLGGF